MDSTNPSRKRWSSARLPEAVRELHRVLASWGGAIRAVPSNRGLGMIAEERSSAAYGRRREFSGQEDHVRVYSKHGFLERLARAAFVVEEHGAESI